MRYLNLNEIREESCMGGTRSYGPILLVHELDLTFLKIWPLTELHCRSSKITQVIEVTDRQTDGRTDGQTDGRTDGQTDGHRSNVFFCDSIQLSKRYL